jgi:hypothetical protein
MLFSPRGVSAARIYALIYILGVLSAYLLSSVFLRLFSPLVLLVSMHPSMHMASCLLTG